MLIEPYLMRRQVVARFWAWLRCRPPPPAYEIGSVALEGVQIMGGYGYATEYPMERHLRTAVVTTIYGGTSEIQKNIIAKTLGL